LPAWSVARTAKVWLPSPRAGEIVFGLEQVVQPPPSMRHSKVEPDSLELKERSGVVLFDGSVGEESMVVFGAVRSTVHVELAGVESVLPAWSVARTWKVWLPPPSAESVCGLVHALQPPLSIWHSKVDAGSVELKEKLGVTSFDGSPGVESMVVFGGVRSTAQL